MKKFNSFSVFLKYKITIIEKKKKKKKKNDLFYTNLFPHLLLLILNIILFIYNI